MYAVLQQHQTVGWLELVMNHKDFSQTVENVFTLSFLVSGQSWLSAVLSQRLRQTTSSDLSCTLFL